MEVRLLKMLNIIVSHGLEGFDSEDRRTEIEAELAEAGYWDFEINRIFLWLSELKAQSDFEAQVQALLEVASEPEASKVATVSLSDRAHTFLSSVRDLGLIDDAMEDEILNQLMMHPGGQVGLDEVRRLTAAVIFDRQFRSGEEYYGIFEEEWKLLFN